MQDFKLHLELEDGDLKRDSTASICERRHELQVEESVKLSRSQPGGVELSLIRERASRLGEQGARLEGRGPRREAKNGNGEQLPLLPSLKFSDVTVLWLP
jgi:hypothetical protein